MSARGCIEPWVGTSSYPGAWDDVPRTATLTDEQKRIAAGWEPAEWYAPTPKVHDVTDTTVSKAKTSINPGELRARLQPTILLRMLMPVAAAPGNTDVDGKVFRQGDVVFAQYIGNGRLLLTPVLRPATSAPQVVMASALNATAEILTEPDLVAAFAALPQVDES